MRQKSARILLHPAVLEQALSASRARAAILQKIEKRRFPSETVLVELGDPPDDLLFESLGEKVLGRVANGQLAIIEWSLDDVQSPERKTPFTETCQSVMDDPIVPYGEAERAKRFPKAMRELSAYLAAWSRLPMAGTAEWANIFLTMGDGPRSMSAPINVY